MGCYYHVPNSDQDEDQIPWTQSWGLGPGTGLGPQVYCNMTWNFDPQALSHCPSWSYRSPLWGVLWQPRKMENPITVQSCLYDPSHFTMRARSAGNRNQLSCHTVESPLADTTFFPNVDHSGPQGDAFGDTRQDGVQHN